MRGGEMPAVGEDLDFVVAADDVATGTEPGAVRFHHLSAENNEAFVVVHEHRVFPKRITF